MAISITPQYAHKRLVAAGNDGIEYENMAGDWTQVTDAVVDTSNQLQMFEAFQKACVVNGTIKGIVDFANTKLDLGEGNELTTAPLPGDVLTQDTTGAQMTVDFVDATKRYIYGYTLTTAKFNATNTVSCNDSGEAHQRWSGKAMSPTTFTPAVVTEPSSGPHWYNWTKHAEFTQDLESEIYLGCLYNGRALTAGFPSDPHLWVASRQGKIFEWDHFSNDAQTALRASDADAGLIGDIIRCLAPWHDSAIVFGCASSIWVCRGDPANNGAISPLDDHTGIYGGQAWCWGDDGVMWFWGIDGIYRLPVGNGIGRPENVTSLNLPRIAKDSGANPSSHRITMGYDHLRHGIMISITKLSDGSNSGFWYDTKTQSFYPESYPTQCGSYAMFNYKANDPDYQGLLIGCTDGYVRCHDDSETDDDIGASDQAIDSHVVLGPAPLNEQAGREGSISGVQMETGEDETGGSNDSDPVTYSVYANRTASGVLKDVQNGAVRYTRTAPAPGRHRGTRNRQKARGAFGAIKLRNNTAGQTWNFEELIINE